MMALSALLFVCLVGAGAASFQGERAITSVRWNSALHLLSNEGERFFSPNFAPLPPPSSPHRIKFDDQRTTYDKKPSTKYSKRGKLKAFKLLNLSEWPLGYDLKSNVLGHYTGGQIYGVPSDDVKPVVEHIEDDIKYDFRTGKHSYD